MFGDIFGVAGLSNFFRWATARDTTAFRARDASESRIRCETAGVTVFAALATDFRVEFFTVFSFVRCGSLHAASLRSRHLELLSAHHLLKNNIDKHHLKEVIVPLYHTASVLSICFFLKMCFNLFLKPEQLFSKFCTNCGKKGVDFMREVR